MCLCASIGVLSGFLGGLLGIGGGVVIVPALIVLFDYAGLFSSAESTIVAVATSLGCVLFTSVSAARTQIKAGKVDWLIVRRWAIFLIIGGLCAGWIAEQLSMPVFRSVIGAFLLFVAFVMLTSWKPSAHRHFPGFVVSSLVGMGGGLISAIAGIGGGNVIVPTLLYFNTPVHRATATSSTLGVPIATAGIIGYLLAGRTFQPTQVDATQLLNTNLASLAAQTPGQWMFGYIYVPALVAIVCTAWLMAPVGVRTAHRLPAIPLRRAFGLLMIFVSARMLYSAFSSWL